MKFSKYQQDIFDWVQNGTGNAVVEAVAGSGKTTTLVNALSHMEGHIYFLAFNKHIATDVQKKVGLPNVTIQTLNALGHATHLKWLKANGIDGKFNGRKIPNILNKLVKDRKLARKCYHPVLEAVSLVKANHNGSNFPNLDSILQEINFPSDLTDPKALIVAILQESVSDPSEFDYDDQILFPVIYDQPFPTPQWVCVDEAQDMNLVQHAFIRRLATKARILAVGDPDQSIYAFRGAHEQSMPLLTKALSAQVLPLSVCYRCSRAVVDHAREIVPRMEHFDQAPPGLVTEGDINYFVPHKEQLILCRTNAPLIKMHRKLAKEGYKSYVLGKEFCETLLTALEEITEKGSPAERMANINQYRLLKLARTKSASVKMHINDIADTLLGFVEYGNMAIKIKSIFEESSDAVVLSTVHKAKGKEFKNVAIIRPDLMPHPMGSLGQETNIKYVAITRAIDTLVFLKGELS